MEVSRKDLLIVLIAFDLYGMESVVVINILAWTVTLVKDPGVMRSRWLIK